MTPVAVIACAALSALGKGADAVDAGQPGAAPRPGLGLRAELELGIRHPLCGAVPFDLPDGDRATVLLELAARDLAIELDRVLPGWRRRKLRVIVGSSAGPMNAACAAYAEYASSSRLAGELARQAPYFAPLSVLERALGVDVRAEQILAACTSSTLAIGIGCRSLNAGHAELVIAGGYDGLAPFVARGFEALGALTRTRPRPFATGRDGMALGEGAALLALAPPSLVPARGHVLGFGSSSDAVHPTAPEREGSGLLAAAIRALADAGMLPDAVDLVSAHATSTPYNDAAEARALARLFGARRVAVHAFKPQVGHTLGAAGALETLVALSALERGAVPATAGDGPLDPDFTGDLSRVARARRIERVLKLSSGFGGVNAALVLGGSAVDAAAPKTELRPVYLGARGAVVSEIDRVAIENAASASTRADRADATSELALTAVATLRRALGRPFRERSAIVVGTASATLEQNAQFDARRRLGRPAEPRRFPGTSPSACAGWCSIVFGLRGPSFSVGSGPRAALEARVVAFDLVAGGDADEAVVVALEDAGPVTTALFEAGGLSPPRRHACALLLAPDPTGEPLDRDRLGSLEVEFD